MARTDAELLIASRDDPRAFRELYDRWADRLLAYFYRRVLDAEVAGDLLAETFAVAFERRGRFKDIGEPGRGVAVRHRRQGAVALVPAPGGRAAGVRRLAIEVPALDDESIARIEALADMETCRAALAAALEQIGAGERNAVRLRVVEEMGYAEIATRARVQRSGRADPRAPRPGTAEPPDGGDVMSEIPFVNQLGDEIEQAAAPGSPASRPDPPPAHDRRARLRGRRHRRRRRIGRVHRRHAGAARHQRDRLLRPRRPRARQRRGALHRRRVTGRGVPPRDAHRRTARRLRRPGRDGLPGRAGTCEKLGLQPLPAEYNAARKRVNRLARRIEAIETSVDCWDPASSSARVQKLLDGLPALARLAHEARPVDGRRPVRNGLLRRRRRLAVDRWCGRRRHPHRDHHGDRRAIDARPPGSGGRSGGRIDRALLRPRRRRGAGARAARRERPHGDVPRSSTSTAGRWSASRTASTRAARSSWASARPTTATGSR